MKHAPVLVKLDGQHYSLPTGGEVQDNKYIHVVLHLYNGSFEDMPASCLSLYADNFNWGKRKIINTTLHCEEFPSSFYLNSDTLGFHL